MRCTQIEDSKLPVLCEILFISIFIVYVIGVVQLLRVETVEMLTVFDTQALRILKGFLPFFLFFEYKKVE